MDIIVDHTHHSNYGNAIGGPGENRGRKYIILHGTGIRPGVDADKEIRFLKRPSVWVSYHYYVTKEGKIVELVPPDARAWHAGTSAWLNDSDLNDLSIGIGFESTNALDEKYPDAQLDAGVWLCEKLMKDYPDIKVSGVLTHRDVSVPQGRKIDPVNWPVERFRLQLKSTFVRQRKVPMYHENNQLIGDITLIEEKKAYMPNELVAVLCDDG